jgi:mono/diheme cytochrome c family protein
LKKVSAIRGILWFVFVAAGVLVLTGTVLAAANGEQLYMTHCSSCHSLGDVDKEGYAGDVGGKPIETVKSRVRVGNNGMPAISSEQLSDAELDVLAAYVYSGYMEPTTTQTPTVTETEAGERVQSAPGFVGVIALLSMFAAVLLFRK